MKKTISILLLLLVTVGMYSQEGINYKALIKDNLGAVVASQTIDVKFTIIADTGPTDVYAETHTGATTDANGIVILTIGSVIIPTLGVFADIDWGSDIHSLKVEIDIEQDGSFVDMGTTQFMSVPYALQAKTAESVSGISGTTNFVPKSIDGVTIGDSQIFDDGTNVGIGTASPLSKFHIAAGAIGLRQQLNETSPSIGFYTNQTGAYLQTHNDFPLLFATNNGATQMILNTNGNLVVGVLTATAKLDVLGDIKIADGTQGAGKILTSDADGLASWQTPGTCGLSIGDTHQGGIIFYLDASGCHGLIAAPGDQSTSAAWWNGFYMITRAYGSGLFEGKYNTKMINLQQGGTTSAAAICANYGDFKWYLPSIEELNLMYENIGQGNALGLGNIGGFVNAFYWSSTEIDGLNAWMQRFDDGLQYSLNKANTNGFVRAVRAF